MTAKTHSTAVKMAAVYLAQQTSAEEAGKAFGVPKRTVARWVNTITLPDESGEWGKIESVLLAQVAEKSARGDARQLVALSTAAGIASRNRRFAQLIARRDARQAEREQVKAATVVDAAEWTRRQVELGEAKESMPPGRLRLAVGWFDFMIETVDHHDVRAPAQVHRRDEASGCPLGRVTSSSAWRRTTPRARTARRRPSG